MTGSGLDRAAPAAHSRPQKSAAHPAARAADSAGTRADRLADRRSYAIVALLLVVSFVVEATSLIIDGGRNLTPFGVWTPFVLEGSSHATLLLAFALVPAFVDRAPLTARTWRWALPVHAAGFLVFSLVHILSFVAIRSIVYAVFGEGYRFGLHDPLVWLYELRKDAFTYALFVILVVLSRGAQYRKMEEDAATEDAREEGRITLKCGGRTLRMRASEIDAASAAGNYVEILCGSRRTLARTTLAALEDLLAAAGGRHVRVHRSHIVNLDAVREVVPTGTGEAEVHLASALTLPVSRRHRDALANALLTNSPGDGAR